MQSLAPEAGRSDKLSRAAFQAELLKVAEAVASGLPHAGRKPDIASAWVFLAMLVGGVTLARAVKDEELAEGIAGAVCNAATLNSGIE